MCCQDFLPLERNGTKLNTKKSNHQNKTLPFFLFPFPSQRKKIPLTGTEDSKLKIYLIPFSQGSTTGEMSFKIQRPLQHLGTCWDK